MEKWIESEGPKPDYRLLCVRLSDELEALRARNAELEAEVAKFKREHPRMDLLIELDNTNTRLKAEVALLRRALKEITDRHLWSDDEPNVGTMMGIAKAALEASDG